MNLRNGKNTTSNIRFVNGFMVIAKDNIKNKNHEIISSLFLKLVSSLFDYSSITFFSFRVLYDKEESVFETLFFTPITLTITMLISKKITMGTATIIWLNTSAPGVTRAATNIART